MVTINCAYTEAINPSAATPKLSREQVWKGLQRKIRKAQDFVPVIEATDVVEEKGDEVTRVAHFKSMHGQPPREVKEICRSFWPCRVGFCFLNCWSDNLNWGEGVLGKVWGSGVLRCGLLTCIYVGRFPSGE